MRRTPLIPLLMALPLVAGVLLRATPAQATFPGTNGKIAFSTDFGDDPQIFTVNPDGSGEKQITLDADGHAFAPDWSPDGTKIVFQGDLTGNQEIYLMNADGSGRTQITNEPGFEPCAGLLRAVIPSTDERTSGIRGSQPAATVAGGRR